jgi:hypothetical protein
MRRLKWLQKSGGVILRDIWPVLNHHITLFSLYEFYLVKVFSSKVFNEVISTKLYASSLIFPTGFFYEWWLQAYFLLEFVWDYSHYPKALCTPYFSHRVFEEIRSWKNSWQIIKWSWIDQGGVLQNITYVINPRGATVFSKVHTLRDTPLHLYISVMICGIQTLVVCLSLRSPLSTTHYNTCLVQTRHPPRGRIYEITIYSFRHLKV